ncbi:MAG: NTP transferase domain-containing protein, partial [Candidatus Cloacimonetes bacterium]|nr:NTP transferase domain-containing protein [Candidatus Cloacimonadota bacterium]
IILRKLAESGCEEVFIARDLDTPDMLSTLRFALNALQGQTNRGYLIYPVDHPLVQVQTIKSLIEAAIRLPSSVIRPCFSGFRGHPVYIPRELDLNADDSEDGLAGIIRNSSVPRFDLPVDDEAILKNINYPSDLETVTL